MLGRVMVVLLHPLVDFCSVVVLMAGGNTLGRWLAYGALAFALQLPLGVALDARRDWGRLGFAVGCLLTASGAMAAALGYAGTVPLCVACVGNALFHLTAGVDVLERSTGKSGPIGLFISTGALGLMAGVQAAKSESVWLVAGVAFALVVGALWRTARWQAIVRTIPANCTQGAGRPRWGAWIVAGLFALVTWRSWAGLLASGMSADAGMAFALAGAAITWAGKAAGGYAADALRARWPTCAGGSSRGLVTAVSVAGSAALCFLCSPSNPMAWLLLLFIAQLATGPVLSLLYDRCQHRAGTAFGLNCFGLFAGSLI